MATSAAVLGPGFRVRPLTVDQYHRMIDANILNETDNVELIEGWLVPRMTRKPPHDSTLDRLEDAVRAALPSGWRVRGQKAVTLSDSEPEPDVAVVRGSAGDYSTRHPGPADIAFVAEVADSTLVYDRVHKQRVYARAGLPIYWVVNLDDRRVEVYTDPETPSAADPRYRTHTDYGPGQDVPVVVAGVLVGAIPVDAILPRV